MSQTDKQQRVQVTIELGHTACFRKKQTADGFTHDWSVFVRGPDGSKIQNFIEKVVFHLHDTFNKPKRIIREPPYQVSESGYASFLLPIDIYFRNKEMPKKINFQYDLYLNAEGGPPINHSRCEKLTFQNPTEEFRIKLLKAGGVQYNNNIAQPFTELFGPPITPESGKKPSSSSSSSSSSGKDKSSKSRGSSSKPSTPQSTHTTSSVSSSSTSSSGPGTQTIASKEPKSLKQSSTTSSSQRETVGQKRPPSPEPSSGKKMKRSSSTSSTTESSSSKHKSHKSSKKKSEDKSSRRKSSSSKHHKDKSDHKEKKKKDSSRSKSSSSSLSKSMPEMQLKNELLSPLHDSPQHSLSPPPSKPDPIYTDSDSDLDNSSKPLSPKDSPVSSLSEDEEEMTRKILAGQAEDSSSNFSKSDIEKESVKLDISSSDSDSDDDCKSTVSKASSYSHLSPKISKNSESHRSSPVKSEGKNSPLKPESKSSKSKHVSSKKSSSSSKSSSEPKSKDKKERSESSSSSSKHSRSKDGKHDKESKDSKSSDKKSKDGGHIENGIPSCPEKAPNGESIKELLDLQVILCQMTDRKKLQHVANLIGPTGLFKVTETAFSFDLCNLESDIVKKIRTAIADSQS